MGTVRLSAIDGMVYMGLGNLTSSDQLDPSVEQQMRDQVIAAHLVDMNISHQALRVKPYRVTINANTVDYPMPNDFGNAVYVQFTVQGTYPSFQPVDICNFVNLPQKTEVGWPAVAFFGNSPVTARVSCFTWNQALAPLVLEIWYEDSTLNSSVDQAVTPIQDIFIPKVVCDTELLCLPHADMTDTKRQLLTQTLMMQAAQWLDRWSKMINRSPSQGPIHRRPFDAGRSYQPTGSWWWL